MFFAFAIWALVSEKAYVLALLFVGLSLLVIFSYKIDHYVLRRNVRNSPHGNKELIITLSEDGFHAKTEMIDTRLKWDAFTSFMCFDNGFILFQGPRYYDWLPDENLSDLALVPVVKELLEKNV